MKHLKSSFRLWWQKPRPIAQRTEDRSVSFLELFYDLSYVMIIAELTHTLVHHFDLNALFGFACLFALVWVAWVNGSLYHELHGNNDVRTRVFTFLQMISLTGMAIFAQRALTDGAPGFAICYASFLVIVTYLWWRTGVHDPDHKPMSQPYSAGFLITAIAFVISAFLQAPYNFYIWMAAALFSTSLPIVLSHFRRNANPEHIEKSQIIHPSMVERFGLLTIIVLGEVIVAVIQGARQFEAFSWTAAAVITLGLFIAICMWWIYFDFVSHQTPVQKPFTRFSWLYLHLPLTMSITLTGAGFSLIIESGGHGIDRAVEWMLVSPIAIFLLCVSLLTQVIEPKTKFKKTHQQAARVAASTALAILALGLFELENLHLLAALAALLALPVCFVFYIWTKHLYRKHTEAV